jgi:hypothetical protein
MRVSPRARTRCAAVLALVSSGAVLGQIVGTGADFYTVTPCRIYDSRGSAQPNPPGSSST